MNAKVDVEDGYTRIANELMDAMLIYPLSGRQRHVLLAIIRKTYGYNKLQDDISLSQIEKVTRLARSHCSTTINELVALNVVNKEKGVHGQLLRVNKTYRAWKDWDKRQEYWRKEKQNEIFEEPVKAKKQPKQKPEKQQEKFNWRNVEIPACISPQKWEGWNIAREEKGRVITEFETRATIEGLQEVYQAGFDANKALDASVNWSAFNADWAMNAQRKNGAKQTIEERLNANTGYMPIDALLNKTNSIDGSCTVIQEPSLAISH